MSDFSGLELAPEVVDAQLAEATPRRKHVSRGAYGFGGGDIAKLFLALGRRPLDSAPRWLREEVEPMKRMGGHPRFLLQKAGRVKRRKSSHAQDVGVNREAELFLAWAESVAADHDSGPLPIDPDSPVWAGALPDEFPPLVDKDCPRLVARIDAWARTPDGALVLPSLKCARYGFAKPAWWNGITEAPWYYELQSQSEMAVCNADHALLVIGCGWIRDPDDPREDGEIKPIRIDRNDALIAEIREAVFQGWAVVEQLRAR